MAGTPQQEKQEFSLVPRCYSNTQLLGTALPTFSECNPPAPTLFYIVIATATFFKTLNQYHFGMSSNCPWSC